MKTASEIMTGDPLTVTPDIEVTQVARLLLENGINGVPVVEEGGRLVGILCQSDLIVQQKRLPIPSLFTFLDGLIPLSSMKQVEKEVKKIAAVTVADAMTPNPVSVEPDTTIETIAALMVDSSFHTIPVVDNGRLVGVIGKSDILKTLIA